MIKIIGESYSEKKFIKEIKEKLSSVKIESIEDYLNFEENPKQIEDENLLNFREKIKELEVKKNKINKNISNINLKNIEITELILENTKLLENPLIENQEEIIKKINKLEFDKEFYTYQEISNKKKLQKLELEIIEIKNTTIPKFKKIFQKDYKILNKIKKSNNFKNLKEMIIFKNNFINKIKEIYRLDNNSYLINNFEIDFSKRGIWIENKTIKKYTIDHILISKKGIFIFEAKPWETIEIKEKKEIINKIKNLKIIFKKMFSQKFIENLKIIIISDMKKKYFPTNEEYEILDINSLNRFLKNQENILNYVQIYEFLKDLNIELELEEKIKYSSIKSLEKAFKVFFTKPTKIIKLKN